MKKQVRFLLLMAAFLVPWVTQAQGVPTSINCTFENDSDTAGWVFVNQLNANNWYIGSATANGGTKSLYISNDGGTTNAYNTGNTSLVYAYKEVSLSEGVYAIAFDWKANGESSYDYLRVLLAPASATLTAGYNPLGSTSSSSFDVEAPPAGWIDLGNGRLNRQSAWQSHYLEFAVTSAATYKLVFFWGNDGSGGSTPPAAIDNIVLNQPACPAPIMTSVSPTYDSVYFNWNGTADSYTLEYADTAFTPGTGQGTVVTTTDLSYALANLSPNSTYYYALSGICGPDNSGYTTGSFETRCAPIGIPYAYGFEATDAQGDCWHFGRGGSSPSTSYPNPNNTTQPYSGARNLYVYNYYTAKYWAAMPLFSTPLSDVMVSFHMRNSSTNAAMAPIKVGYMTNVSDPSSFVPVYSRVLNNTNWTQDFVLFPDSISYPSSASIAFMFDGSGSTSSSYYYLDQIEVIELPECPLVADINASVGVSSAIVTWSYNANTSRNTPEEYIIAYAPISDSGTTDATEVTPNNVANNSYTITGLNPATNYRIWVSSVCDGNAGFTDSIDITTSVLPCVSFDTNLPGTTMQIGEGDNAAAYVPFYYNYYHSYAQVLYSADEMNGAQVITSMFLQRPLTAPNSFGALSDLTIYMGHAEQSTLEESFVTFDTNNFQLVKSGITEMIIDSTTGWVEFVMDTPFNYNGTENLVIIFNSSRSSYSSQESYNKYCYTNVPGAARYDYSDGSAFNPATMNGTRGSSASYRPNIRFALAGCATPAQCARPVVAVDYVEDTLAHVVWTPGYLEYQWDVFYRRSGATEWILATAGTTEQEYTITGLQGGSSYEVAVMGICEDSLMTRVPFTTECGIIYRHLMPYVVDVASLTETGSGVKPPCWTSPASGSNNTYPYVYAYSNLGRGNVLYWYTTNTGMDGMAVLPELEMSIDSVELYLDLYRASASYSGTLVAGVMTDPLDITTFEPFDTLMVPVVGNWVSLGVDFGTYDGEGTFIALTTDKTLMPTGTTTEYMYASNIEVIRRSDCRPLTKAYATNISFDGADIVIEDADNVDANNYVLYYSLENDLATAIDTIEFTGTTANITGLLYDTTYYAWVGVQCSDDNSRVRAIDRPFTTLPPCMPVENLVVSTSIANGTAVLSWEPPTEAFPATKYVVSYKGPDAAWIVDTTTNTYFVISGLVNNVNYQYSVRTICDSIEGLTNDGNMVIIDNCAYVGSEEGVQEYAPINGYYAYSYNQSIYLSSEMSAIGDTIYGVFFQQEVNDVVPYTYTLDVYLGHTDDTAFADEMSWVPSDSLTQVTADYDLYINRAGSYYIPFTTPFVRDNSRNLVIAINKGMDEYVYPYPQWLSTTTSGYRSIFTQNDEYNIDPDDLSNEWGDIGDFVPDVLFSASCNNSSTDACAAPLLICSGKTATSLDINWFAGGTETSWDVEYRSEGATSWTSLLPNTTTTSTTITGLSSALLYEVRVSHVCGGDTLSTTRVFSTACGAITLPYVESFALAANGTYSRTCWQTGADNDVLPTVGNYTNFGKMLLLDDGAYLVAPSFSVPANQMQVNVSHWSTVPGTFFYVGIITDANFTQTFIPIDTIYSWDETSLSNATVHFNSYTGTEGNICFFMPSGYPLRGQHFIENLIFDLNSNCPSVDSIWMVSTNNTDATIAWSTDGIGVATNYIVEYGVAGFTPGTGTTVTASTATATLNNLALGTVYEAYVTPICNNGDTMYRSAACRFTSECGAMSIPYVMNFDLPYLPPVTATHMMPACWTYEMLSMGTSTTTYYYPQVYINRDHATSGAYMLYTYYQSVMALPEMAEPLDTLQVSFYAYGTSSSYQLVVGVVDSVAPGFAASFTPIDTIDVYNANSGVYDTVTFCGFRAPGQRIAFKNQYKGTAQYSYVYIDDVVVDYRPACMPVNSIVMDTNSETMAAISWNACGTNPSFEIEYGPEGFEQGQGTTVTTNNTNYTFTGLFANSAYDVYIRTVCGAGSYSDWVRGFIYTTMVCDATVATPMYSTDTTAVNTISQYVPGYSYYKYTFSQVIYDSASLAAAGFTAGSLISGFAFYPTTFGTYRDYYTNTQVYMQHTDKDAFASSMDIEPMSASSFVYSGDLNWTDSTVQRVVMFDRAFMWDGESNIIIAIDRNHGAYNSGAKFAAQTDSTIRVAYAYSDATNLNPMTLEGLSGSSKGTSADVPNFDFFSCLAGLCNAPVVTVATTYSDATLSWTSDATNFEVNVKAVADATWPAATTVADAYSYVASGLQPATAYQYRVRALCSEEEISDWVEGTFTTDSLPCFAPTNLTATPAKGTAEMSWTNGGEETAWNIHVWNTAFDQTFTATANPFSVTGLTQGTEYYAAIQSVCGGGVVTSEFSDTITFTTDVCDPVTNVTATVSGTTATVTWTAGEDNTGNFVIEYGIAGFASGSGTTVNATTTSVEITDLESETSYEVYVRAVCDGQYNSAWSDPATFQTEIGINTVNGNNQVSIYPNPAEQSTTISVSGVEGDVTVTIVDMNGRTVSTYTMVCNGDCEKMMNVENLAAGSYFVRLQGNGLNTVKKLVIK